MTSGVGTAYGCTFLSQFVLGSCILLTIVCLFVPFLLTLSGLFFIVLLLLITPLVSSTFLCIKLRDRPFNLQGGVRDFCFIQNFFFRITRELEYFFFVSNLTLGYMTKTLNQIICFPPPKSEYFFQRHWEADYSFQVKLAFPMLMFMYVFGYFVFLFLLFS